MPTTGSNLQHPWLPPAHPPPNPGSTHVQKGSRLEYLHSFVFICGSKLIRIHMAGCHPAALTGCGGRVKCRCRSPRPHPLSTQRMCTHTQSVA